MRLAYVSLIFWYSILVSQSYAESADSISAFEAVFPGVPFIISTDLRERSPSLQNAKYPKDALKGGICGEVATAVKVAEDGKVLDAKIVKSEPPNVFDQAALDAIVKWQFKKMAFNGKPVIYQTKFVIKFRLGTEECLTAK